MLDEMEDEIQGLEAALRSLRTLARAAEYLRDAPERSGPCSARADLAEVAEQMSVLIGSVEAAVRAVRDSLRREQEELDRFTEQLVERLSVARGVDPDSLPAPGGGH
ncbi:MAG: hypothetical protein D6702_10755 [Planctomycetota bacterium]|nr:MAG: hypothetical protein D6702_10755 [Planctomycetota bacterium]